MSNVVKIKTAAIDTWKKELEEGGDKLLDRLYDQIKLTDGEMEYEDVPEDYADSMILGVIISLLAMLNSERKVLSTDKLLMVVGHVVKEQEK